MSHSNDKHTAPAYVRAELAEAAQRCRLARIDALYQRACPDRWPGELPARTDLGGGVQHAPRGCFRGTSANPAGDAQDEQHGRDHQLLDRGPGAAWRRIT